MSVARDGSDRVMGPAWPRRLGFRRPENIGDAAGAVIEFPIGAHGRDLALSRLTSDDLVLRDRVTFISDNRGIYYTGVVRYTSETTYVYGRPHGWHSFQRGREATRNIARRGVGAIRRAWNRWLGY
ncbi:hypothetical protein F5Y11DRAFT_322491 [Daldinia sp. FL1419]|nr:hypothetical protein F5Y11DRAFT_322491 [Daldinia sp. FL1419]